MDFYLDHTPDVLSEKKNVPTMNANIVRFSTQFLITFIQCAAKGKELIIERFHVKLVQNVKSFIINQDFPEFSGKAFVEGSYQHCFKFPVPEALEEGPYELLIEVIEKGTNNIVGCLVSYWRVKKPSA